MKLNELLSRYLFRRRSRRERRKKSALHPSPVTLVDIQLESRILLSGTSQPEPAATDAPTITIRSAEAGNAAVISVVSESSFTITAGDLYLAAANAVDTTDHWDLVVVETSPPELPDDSGFDAAIPPADVSRTLLASGFGTQNFFVHLDGTADNQNLRLTDASTLLQFDGHQLQIVDTNYDASPGPRGAAPDIANQIGQTKISPIETARNESSIARSDIDTAAASDDSSISSATNADRSDTTVDANSSDNVGSSHQPIDLFFAAVLDNPFWSVESEEVSHAPRAQRYPKNDIRPSVLIEFQEDTLAVEEQTYSIDSLKRRTEKSLQKSSAAKTSVFTTSDSKTTFAELLNSFVQFDTSQLLEEDQALTDWLSEQLGLTAFGEEVNDLEASTVSTTFADTNEVANNEEQIERLQQSFLKIDYSSSPDAAITILSDQPPVPPEIVGIWQRIRFDCNPRGPPVSDRATGFGFSSFPVGTAQLQQLRYSIAPRGPSVASVN